MARAQQKSLRHAHDLAGPQTAYAEMKRMASLLLRRYGLGYRRTTSLVHEAYLRMIAADDVSDYSTRRLLGVAARAMRSVLIDQARSRLAAKRGFNAKPLSLADWEIAATLPDEALLQLHECLEHLRSMDVRKARLVELRYFGGLTTREASEVLGISQATVKREWAVARTWLHRQMTGE